MKGRELSISLSWIHAFIYPDQLPLNYEVSADLKFIANNLILHVAQTHNAFQDITVLRSKTGMIYG